MKAIEHISEYKISKGDLALLDEDAAAAVAVTCFAATEINALMRLYLVSTHDFIENDVIDTANAIQRSVLLRIWSAKLFEFSKFIELSGKDNKTKNAELISLANEAQEKFVDLKQAEIYPLVRSIRNETTNHYSLRPARKNLLHVADNANLTLYMHKIAGNSFYPLGEEVMFTGRINRYGSDGISKEEKMKLYGDWLDWNLTASNWLGDVHYSFVKKLILDRFPDKHAAKKDHWIPPEMVGEAEENQTPLFIRTEIYDRKKASEDK